MMCSSVQHLSAAILAVVILVSVCNAAGAFSAGSIPRASAPSRFGNPSLSTPSTRRCHAIPSQSAINQSLQESDALGCDNDRLETMTVPQLKEQLRLRGKKVSGRKTELIDRLLDDSEDAATATAGWAEGADPASSEAISIEEEFRDASFHNPSSKDGDDIAWGGVGVPTYEEYKEKLEVLAFLSSMGDDGAAKQAQHTFDEMFENYITEDMASLQPDTHIYNLLIEAYANSVPEINRKGAQMSERILERMEGGNSGDVAPPNVDTYIAVMGGYAKRKQPLVAEDIFRRLEARYASTGNDDVRPNTESYNALIKAWMKSGLAAAPKRTEDLLHEMFDANDVTVMPNADTFAHVMNCYAQNRGKGAVQKVQALIDEMERLGLKPNSLHYNCQIKSLGGRGVKGGASKAEALLFEMIERYKSSGEDSAKPNNASFINAINALTMSRQKNAPQRAEKMVKAMESISDPPGDDGLRPNVKVFNACINAWARSQEPGKAEASRRLLEKMMDLSANDNAMTPNTRTFNNVLNACAFTEGAKEEKLNAFRIAVRTLNALRDSEGCEPDHVSYGMFLKACSKLMPPSEKRDSVVENMFRTCSRDGNVSQFVLDSVAEAASEDLLTILLGTANFDNDIDIPVEWSRSVD